MIHGLGGDATTWGRFPELLADDADIVQRFEIAAPYTYTTSQRGGGPGIADLARELATHLEREELASYPKIVILAHSMGGLVAKRLVADTLIAGAPLRVDRIMAFASPLLGAGGASAAKLVRGAQLRDLAIGSDFVVALGWDWAATDADRRVVLRHVVAGDDALVASWSSTAGFRHSAYDTIGGVGHIDSVKPKDTGATSFQLARQFLLDTKPVGHRAPDARHYEQPVLDATTWPDARVARDNVGRFLYRARAVPWFGREREWQALAGFLAGDDPFRWMVISGAGGTGKSRIALEFCLANSDDWYAGFLTKYGRSRGDWERWQPLLPTLLVLDYATQDPKSTRDLLHELARRTMPGTPFPLPQPVRVLLLIRPADQRTLDDDVITAGDATMPVRATGAPQPLTLGEISDPWPIFETIYAAAGKPLPDKGVTLQVLSRIDQQNRPLFAIFLADAMAWADEAEPELHHLDSERLLADVIQRWRSRFWRPAYLQAGLGRGNAEETLLALATMCGGIPVVEGRLPAATTAKLFPEWDPYQHPQVLEAMTGKSARDEVPTLEPDLVGEHFVVGHLAQHSDSERACLVNLAWSINAHGMAAFVDRVVQDLPEEKLQGPVLSGLLRSPVLQTLEATQCRSHLCINLLARLHSLCLPEIGGLLTEMKAYADTYAEATLRESWAKGAFNVLNDLRASDPAAARALLIEMKAYADTHAEATLREPWANGAFNVLNDLRASDPAAARALLIEMKAYADTHAEATLRESWANGAVNVLNDLRASDPAAARRLYLEVVDALSATTDFVDLVALTRCCLLLLHAAKQEAEQLAADSDIASKTPSAVLQAARLLLPLVGGQYEEFERMRSQLLQADTNDTHTAVRIVEEIVRQADA